MLALTSCDVHQFPAQMEDPDKPGVPNPPDDPVYPDDPDKYVDLDMKVEYATDMYLWEHYYDPKLGKVVESYPEENVDGNHPGTTDIFPGKVNYGLKHITARFFVYGYTEYVREEEFTEEVTEDYDTNLPIRIMPGDYDVVVWTDFIESEEHSRFYDASNFQSIKIDYDYFKANSDHRDTFRGRKYFTLGEEGGTVTVEMNRPMAKYEFITTDLSEFLERETVRRELKSTRASIDDYVVKIYYSTYHPSAYSAIEDILRDSSTGINFETEVTVTGESEASLGYDYVFINEYADSGVQATIVVYDKEGNSVAQSHQITVPLRRDHHTLLRGAFLTQKGEGGVGIDPGYNGDHNIIP